MVTWARKPISSWECLKSLIQYICIKKGNCYLQLFSATVMSCVFLQRVFLNGKMCSYMYNVYMEVSIMWRECPRLKCKIVHVGYYRRYVNHDHWQSRKTTSITMPVENSTYLTSTIYVFLCKYEFYGGSWAFTNLKKLSSWFIKLHFI